MKEITGFEISFYSEVSESVLIEHFSSLLGIPSSQIWDWTWGDEPWDEVKINLFYRKIPENGEIIANIIFNEFHTVEDLFELDSGMYFSRRLWCSVLVYNPSISDTYLRIYPDGIIDLCEEGKNEKGETFYGKVISKGLIYNDIKLAYYSKFK